MPGKLSPKLSLRIVSRSSFMAWYVFLAQAIDLLLCIVWHTSAALLAVPGCLLRALLQGGGVCRSKSHPLFDPEEEKRSLVARADASSQTSSSQPSSCSFYEGVVTHVRRAPVFNSFR